MADKRYYDRLVYVCKDCGRIYDKAPPPTSYRSYRMFCDGCGGDVEARWNLVQLALSVRPVPRLKGDRHHQMWRWRCASCGRVSELAYGSAGRHHTYWMYYKGGNKHYGEPAPSTHERCIPCGALNRIKFPIV